MCAGDSVLAGPVVILTLADLPLPLTELTLPGALTFATKTDPPWAQPPAGHPALPCPIATTATA